MSIFWRLKYKCYQKYFITEAKIVSKALYAYCHITHKDASCTVCKISKQCRNFLSAIPDLQLAISDAVFKNNKE